jgi:hypothetical protein
MSQDRDASNEARRRAVRQQAASRQRGRRLRRAAVGGAIVALVAAVVLVVVLLASGTSAPSIRGLQTFPETNHKHVTGVVVYDRTPPAGGAHSAVWQNCGVYDRPVGNVHAVHSLEHGAVWITYLPSLSNASVQALRAIAVAHYDGTQRYVLLTPYAGLPSPIVASAWGAQLRLHSASDPRLVQFLHLYVGGGQGGEKGAPCTGGTGSPLE